MGNCTGTSGGGFLYGFIIGVPQPWNSGIANPNACPPPVLFPAAWDSDNDEERSCQVEKVMTPEATVGAATVGVLLLLLVLLAIATGRECSAAPANVDGSTTGRGQIRLLKLRRTLVSRAQ